MSKEGKHHYIPVLYLKQWAGSDRKVCEFKRRYGGVLPRRVHPDSTGYVHGLNTVPNLPPEEAQYIETEYLQKLDHKASLALEKLITGSSLRTETSPMLTVAWASFLYSLILRTPEVLSIMQDRFDKTRADLASMSEDSRTITDDDGNERTIVVHQKDIKAPEFLPTFLSSKLVIRGLAAMQWAVKSVRGAKHALLTSDRPVIMTNGLAKPTDHLALPLSPMMLFFATNSQETHNSIASMTANQLVETSNNKVAEQAVKFVYGVDDSQLRFVVNRFGKRVQSTPLG